MRRGPVSVRREVVTFALSGFVVLLVLGLVGVWLVRRAGTNEAIRNAKEVTEIAGRGVVAPALGPAVVRGEPAELARLDRVVRTRVLRDPVVRVKIWTAAGRIIYSDERRLVGETYALGEDEREAIRNGEVDAEVSDLSRPENRYDREWSKLLEVYLPVRASDGTRLLFEAYLRFSAVSESGRRLLGSLVPALVGALALLWLTQVPLATRLARRLREGQREREGLLRRAVESSQVERRRIARDLHDGPVQNLAGVAYSLAGAAAEAPPSFAPTLDAAAAETRATIRELRSLLVEIYPPDLHRTGLEAALRDLLAPFATRGIATSLELPPAVALPPALEALLYRAAQEALRNVLVHADAEHVRVDLDLDGGVASLVVADDGRGFVPEEADESEHFGLRLLGDLARDADGELDVDSAPGAGTRVRLRVPLP